MAYIPSRKGFYKIPCIIPLLVLRPKQASVLEPKRGKKAKL
jgi:hypothetical protein